MKTRRLFFALWPDMDTRRKIKECRNRLSLKARCRHVPVSNLHITLHFIGSVPEDNIDCFRQQASRVKVPPFRLQLDVLGCFQRAKVLWMGMREMPKPLLDLQESLGHHLLECGYTAAQNDTPHVTLARHCAVAQQTLDKMSERPFSINWDVEHFVLVESVTDRAGAQYHVIDSFAADMA